jgi:molybdate transport repressor ModE-like protein
MELEVRHLRVLCAIADTGSLHRAARELGLAQPSLSAQLRRIEHLLGAPLFVRSRTGCRPTPLGHAVLSRARPLVTEFAAIVAETRAAAARAAGGPRLRIGATASRAIPGWMRRLRTSAPDSEPTLQMDVSANSLLRMVAAGRLDLAFVHEVEGSPLRVPPGLCLRVLLEREPQFVTLAADHPAAAHRVVRLTDLAGERWMVDSTVDGEWDALCRVLRAAGLEPDMLHGDYLTAYSLAAIGEVVTVSQPTAHPRPDLVARPLRGDPIGVRLLLAARTETELDRAYRALEEAYWEAARQAPVYQQWLNDRRPAREAADAAERADPAREADPVKEPDLASEADPARKDGPVQGAGPVRGQGPARKTGPEAVPAAPVATGARVGSGALDGQGFPHRPGGGGRVVVRGDARDQDDVALDVP